MQLFEFFFWISNIRQKQNLILQRISKVRRLKIDEAPHLSKF